MNFTIEHYGWGQTGPFPAVGGMISADERQINIQFDVRETEIRAHHAIHNEMVCDDSCVEFFCLPYPFDPRYINIEINPVGTVHFAIGESRHNRLLLPAEHICALDVQTTVRRSSAAVHWTVKFTLPYTRIAEIYEQKPIAPGSVIHCNFYKCGDLLSSPHWGSWGPVRTEQPDFHRPEFFGEVAL